MPPKHPLTGQIRRVVHREMKRSGVLKSKAGDQVGYTGRIVSVQQAGNQSAEPGYPPQSSFGPLILTGLGVYPDNNMDVAVGAGRYLLNAFGGTPVQCSGGTLTIVAGDPSDEQFLWVDGEGNLGASADFQDAHINHGIVLASIWAPAGTVVISGDQITDLRRFGFASRELTEQRFGERSAQGWCAGNYAVGSRFIVAATDPVSLLVDVTAPASEWVIVNGMKCRAEDGQAVVQPPDAGSAGFLVLACLHTVNIIPQVSYRTQEMPYTPEPDEYPIARITNVASTDTTIAANQVADVYAHHVAVDDVLGCYGICRPEPTWLSPKVYTIETLGNVGGEGNEGWDGTWFATYRTFFSGQATLDFMTLRYMFQLPPWFHDWSDYWGVAMYLWYKTDSADVADNVVTLNVHNGAALAAVAGGASATWATLNLTKAQLNAAVAWAPGNYCIIEIGVDSKDANVCYIAEIQYRIDHLTT